MTWRPGVGWTDVIASPSKNLSLVEVVCRECSMVKMMPRRQGPRRLYCSNVCCEAAKQKREAARRFG